MKTSVGSFTMMAVLAAAGMACSVGSVSATSITLVNSTTNNATLNQTVATPMGGSSSTVGSAGYGATGYVMFGTDVPSNVTYGYTETGTAPTAVDVNYSYNTGNIATLESLPSWLTTTTTSGTNANIAMDPSLTAANYFTAAAYGYPTISIKGQPAPGSYPTNNGVATGSLIQTGEGGVNGTTTGTMYNLYDITLGANAPSNFKLGIVTPQGYDALSQIQLTDGTASATAAIDPNQNMGFYFFNVSGAKAGDVLVVAATTSPTIAGYFTHNPYGTSTDITGLTFDAATPEPATLGLFAIGGMSLMLLRRKLAR